MLSQFIMYWWNLTFWYNVCYKYAWEHVEFYAVWYINLLLYHKYPGHGYAGYPGGGGYMPPPASNVVSTNIGDIYAASYVPGVAAAPPSARQVEVWGVSLALKQVYP